MRYRTTAIPAVAALAGAAIAASTPILAHHSFSSEFDVARPVAVEGEITKLRIANPHGWIYRDVKDPDGSTTNWGFEFGSPTTLDARGSRGLTFQSDRRSRSTGTARETPDPSAMPRARNWLMAASSGSAAPPMRHRPTRCAEMGSMILR